MGVRHASLFARWRAGGSTARPLPKGVIAWRDGVTRKIPYSCPLCDTTVYGWTEDECRRLLAGHRRRRHE